MINIAIIPARSGSARLKNKNRKKINGISLVNRSINFAEKLNFLDKIIVSTDDKKILKETKKNYNSIITIKRPKFLAQNKSKSEDAIIHAIDKIESKFGKVGSVLLLQPTSPFRSIKLVKKGYKKFNLHKEESVVSVSKSSKPFKRNFKIKKKLVLSKKNNKNTYQIDGNFYFATPFFLKKYNSFFFKNKTYPIILRQKKLSVDIDTKEDLKKAKFIFKK